MKKAFFPLLTAGIVLSLTACSFANSFDSGKTSNAHTSEDKTSSTGEIDVDIDDLDYILNKYDEAGYVYSYSGEEVTIRMAHWDSSGATVERQVIEALLRGFNARYPSIHVDLQILGDYEGTYGNNLVANNVADVFLAPDGAFTSWAGLNKMVNLTPYVQASRLIDTDAMFPSVISRYQYNAAEKKAGSGVQLALPKDVGPYVMYYNRDIFDQLGLDYPPSDRVMTIDEAIEMWSALTKRNDDGEITRYALGGLGPEGLVWSAGGDFLNAERDAFPEDAKTLAGLKKGYQFMQDAYLTYEFLPPSEWTAGTDASDLFSMQRIATVIAGRWETTSFKSLGFNWDVAFVPAFDENIQKNMYSGSVGYSIFSGTQHLEASWKLVEYIASREGQEILSATGFQIPCYYDLALDKDVIARESANSSGYSNYKVFVDSAQNQSYGLWQYRANSQWKTLGYDTTSERLYDTNPATRWTVDEFLAEAKIQVNNYIS